MRRFTVLAAVLVCTLAQAQEAALTPADASTPDVAGSQTRRLNRLTVGPLGLAFGVLPIEYERALTDQLSIAIGPQLQFSAGLAGALGVSAYGFGSSVSLRAFPLKGTLAPDGLWVGPELRGAWSNVSAPDVTSTTLSFGVLGTAGYTFTSAGGFTASFGGGVGLGFGAESATVGGSTSADVALTPALSLHAQLGYAF